MIRKRTISAFGVGVGALALGVALAIPASADANPSYNCGAYGTNSADLSTYQTGTNNMITISTTLVAPANVPAGDAVTLTTTGGTVLFTGTTNATPMGSILSFSDLSGPLTASPHSETIGSGDYFKVVDPKATITCTETAGGTLTW